MSRTSILPKWLRALFVWRDVRDNGTWAYQENAVTGARRAVRIGACYSPKDMDWLERRDPPTGPMPPIVEPADLRTIAPSLDEVPDSLERPLIGYLSKNGHRIFSENDDWSTMICRDRADLNPKGGVVEVEIRVLRVIPEGAR
jgi:hypothetical protein